MKYARRTFALLLVILMLAVCTAVAEEPVYSGKCGDNAYWSFDEETRVLTISGRGDMEDYDYYYYYSPWSGLDVCTVIIEEGITSIGNNAFDILIKKEKWEEGKIEKIIMPSSLRRIGIGALSSYVSEEITIPAGVLNIKGGSFTGCDNLKNIYVDQKNPNYCSVDGILFNKDKTELVAYPAGKTELEYKIPSDITALSSYAFYKSSLVKIEIPDGITEIPRSAFLSCQSLAEITLPDSVTYIGYEAFRDCYSLSEIKLPENLIEIGSYAFAGLKDVTKVIIPESVEKIGFQAWDANEFEGQEYLSPVMKVYFKGNAPEDAQFAFVANSAQGISTLYYVPGKTGWTDSDIFDAENGTWNRYKLLPWDGVNIPEDNTKELTLVSSIPGSGDVYNDASNVDRIVLTFNKPLMASANLGQGSICIKDYEIDEIILEIDNNKFYSYGGTISGNTITIPLYDLLKAGKYYITVDAKAVTPQVNEDGSIPTFAGIDDKNEIVFVIKGNSTRYSELKEIDYLAFSDFAYWDFPADLKYSKVALNNSLNLYWIHEDDRVTIRRIIENRHDWEDDRWASKTKTLYSELYNRIQNWRILAYAENYNNGFYAMALINDYNEVIISYRGSLSLNNAIQEPDELLLDWGLTDIFMLLGTDASQVSDAMEFYRSIAKKYDSIHVTGHSLGGSLAQICSACFDVKGTTFNSGPFIANAYEYYSKEMSENFHGTDMWKYIDYINEGDWLVGNREKDIKTHFLLEDTYKDEYNAHSLKSLVTRRNDELALTTEPDEEGIFRRTKAWAYRPSDWIANPAQMYFGTSKPDVMQVDPIAVTVWTSNAFGGDSGDNIVTGLWADVIAGGKGNDIIDGLYGNDAYYYYKGDGFDYLYDVFGYDKLYLLNFSADDVIKIEETTKLINVKCNDELLISIGRDRHTMLSSFTVYIERDGKTTEMDISSMFKKKIVEGRYVIACPINIQILDEDQNILMSIDGSEEGIEYTDYGRFYVIEGEEGDLVKAVDLYKGYSIRIIGTGTGTMDIAFYELVEDELVDPVGANDVPITPQTIINVVEGADGSKYLVVDGDGDGVVDRTILLTGGVTVMLDANGGSCDKEYLTAGHDGKIAVLPNAKKDGADFIGWYTAKQGGEEVHADTVFGQDCTLYARYDDYVEEQVISGVCGNNLTWQFVPATGALVLSGHGDMTNYASAADVPWHDYVGAIRDIALPNGMTSVGSYAFYGCTEVEALVLPQSIKSIGANVFFGCSGLQSMIIPEAVSTLLADALAGCSGINRIVVLNKNTVIENGAFAECAEHLVVNGYDGSSAEMQAAAVGANFVAIGVQIENCTHDIALAASGGTLSSGNYYLGSDVTLITDLFVSGGSTVNLCLNGYVITGTGNGSVIYVDEGGELNLCDCRSSTVHRFTDNNGLWVRDEVNGNKQVSGGVITGGIESGSAINNRFGTVTISGGNLVGNRTVNSTHGGGIYNYGGTVVMTGGSITGNLATEIPGDTLSSGAGVYNAGMMLFKGGVISYNTAELGAGISSFPLGDEKRRNTESIVLMTGGSIVDNHGGYSAGGVNNNSLFVMTGGGIRGNRAGIGNAAGVSSFNEWNGGFFMSGGVIENNQAIAEGEPISFNYTYGSAGGVLSAGDSPFIMTGGKITGNTAHTSSGGVENQSRMVLTDSAIITGNTSVYYGGGIRNNGIMTMAGGSITGNTSKNSGGVQNLGEFYLLDGDITGNQAMDEGGGIDNRGTFMMLGGTIQRNKAAVLGGGIFHRRGIFGVSGNVLITGNTQMSEEDRMDSDVYLAANKNFSVLDALNKTAVIGVLSHEKPEPEYDILVATGHGYACTDQDANRIFSNDPKYAVIYDAGDIYLRMNQSIDEKIAGDLPMTGDYSNLMIWYTAAILSVGFLIVLKRRTVT